MTAELIQSSYQTTFTIKRLWWILGISVVLMFGVLLLLGREIYQVAPPIPSKVVSSSGELIFTESDIQRGQGTWQSMGGMQQGSIWGHGGYVAPDWSADWLQREAKALLLTIERETPLPDLEPDISHQAHRAELRSLMRTNTYDETTREITIHPWRASAIRAVSDHYRKLYTAADDEALKFRRDYAMPLHATLRTRRLMRSPPFSFGQPGLQQRSVRITPSPTQATGRTNLW